MDDVIAGGEKESEEERERRVMGGGGVEKRRTRIDKLPMRPQESIWTPPPPPAHQQRSQGDSALHPHYERAVAVTGDCGQQYGFTALSRSLSFTLTVYSHHGRDMQGAVLDRPPETF